MGILVACCSLLVARCSLLVARCLLESQITLIFGLMQIKIILFQNLWNSLISENL